MGCCASNREGKDASPMSDEFTKRENEMQIGGITIMEFQKILKEAAGDRTITVA